MHNRQRVWILELHCCSSFSSSLLAQSSCQSNHSVSQPRSPCALNSREPMDSRVPTLRKAAMKRYRISGLFAAAILAAFWAFTIIDSLSCELRMCSGVPPNKQLEPTAFGASIRGESCYRWRRLNAGR